MPSTECRSIVDWTSLNISVSSSTYLRRAADGNIETGSADAHYTSRSTKLTSVSDVDSIWLQTCLTWRRSSYTGLRGCMLSCHRFCLDDMSQSRWPHVTHRTARNSVKCSCAFTRVSSIVVRFLEKNSIQFSVVIVQNSWWNRPYPCAREKFLKKFNSSNILCRTFAAEAEKELATLWGHLKSF